MGSVTGVVDAAANVSAEARWDAFGELRSGDVSSAVAGGGFGLHGMWLDDSTGLYYVRARTYDARTGRFLSRDPVAGVTGRPESYMPYVFVYGNPVVLVDPSGRFTLNELNMSQLAQGVLNTMAIARSGAGILRALRSAQALSRIIKQALANPVARRILIEIALDVGLSAVAALSSRATPSVDLYHGSYNNYSKIRAHGFTLGTGSKPGVSRDKRIAEDAISYRRLGVQGLTPEEADRGIVVSRIPKPVFDYLFLPAERPYRGFHPQLIVGGTEILLTNDIMKATYNIHIAR